MKKRKVEDWLKKKQERRVTLGPDQIFAGIREGDRAMLSAGITLVESKNPEHRADANSLIQLCLPFCGNSIRVGITGVPGVGKSTFIESFGQVLIEAGKKVAVLAIDPSSAITGGSILGDKTRMQELSTMDEVFIRPSPAGDTLGGVARKTRESIVLCEAAGFDMILIETVGVGQSETVVKSMVDFFLLLMLSGAGDELQGIKKGIMEMADALVITKADGDNVKKSNLAAREYKNALHLFPPNANDWIPEVFTCSSLDGTNVDRVYQVIEDFEAKISENGFMAHARSEQDALWLSETLKELILSDFFLDEEMLKELKIMEVEVANGAITSFQAADKIYQTYKNARRV
ncbi:MAG: methylmalonyl Co-A mutase-associated GTPase MeaB [Crocinitomicaceae bacterium]|nr:methylmalonyl Co-A mutase-associated GTPase MeaB [Crocinitomicaceae bacterium]